MTGFALTHPSTEASARALENDGEERGDSPTPRGSWRAIFAAAFEHMSTGVDSLCMDALVRARHFGEPLRALSLMAGYGSDASELRKLAAGEGWPVHITGVELCEARRPHLEKWCDGVWIGDWRAALSLCTRLGFDAPFDIIVTNPDYKLILENKRKDLALEDTLVPTLLKHAPAVLVLHQEQSLLKSKRGREVWRRWPPAAVWLIGPASFSGDGKQDSRCYWATLWLRGHSGPTSLHMLRELSKDERRWTVPPGSEEPSDECPAAPGWSP